MRICEERRRREARDNWEIEERAIGYWKGVGLLRAFRESQRVLKSAIFTRALGTGWLFTCASDYIAVE